jgi:hypothetical protein
VRFDFLAPFLDGRLQFAADVFNDFRAFYGGFDELLF